MKINEIFYSIQGEGLWSGLPNIFIRFTGCNLRCSYCDTKYAYEDGEIMSIDIIIQNLSKYTCSFVCITGGEPLIQDDIVQLIDNLLKKGYYICLETNGSIDIGKFVNIKRLLVSLDIKCPSSNMHEKMKLKNISLLTTDDQLKFIIKNKTDYEYAKKIIQKYKPKGTVFLQPVWGSNLEEISTWILHDGLKVRMGLQLHKIIWGDKRGN